ncbi:aspartate-semialdehyde dehydrogenase [Thiomicrospira sp. WB1]|uniref:aspartate-semialdehyde dehydrogenase n=1 Tax=Thiomicrospira sp. WB1 TaxID=1685380 RepID=UPI00074A8AFF|nr:aspartate-semialdehyde dehydrogenase [Thiomicrospira sp. WB1]KUJ72201.1 aspartate-semialdehyde dehydrogenase [Thiomicrospira sp. WB1]
MTKQYDIAVAGATGAVGETILKVLEERNFPVRNLYPLASSRSAGKKIEFNGSWVEIQDLATFDFSKVQIGLFSPGGSVSREYAPKAAAAGCVVVDNTSEFRYDDDVPLVVPEVNPDAVAGYTQRNIIANPNCSTIQMMVAIKPIHDAVGIKRINVSTYQAVSGSGKEAIEELAGQTRDILNLKPVKTEVYPKQIAFNCIPQIDVFQDNGYTKEEMKMVWETKKILEDESVLVNPTAVRVPVFYGHSEAIHLETDKKITADEAKALFEKTDGIVLMDQHEDGGYPTAVTDAADTDPVYVGRVREDITCDNGLNIWVVADNVRKGAATNTVQIAELLIKDHL